MKISEIKSERITKEMLESYIKDICSSVKFYGKMNNMLFIMKDQNTGVFDLENDRFIISDRRGIAYPVIDENNNNYFMVISSKNDDNVRYKRYGQPRYDDTSSPRHMYDKEIYFRDTECYCNIFDENNINVQPIDKYLANIYQFNSMLDKNGEYKTIKYRDAEDGNYRSSDKNKYLSYSNLPSHIDDNFLQVLSLSAIKEEAKYNSLKKDKNAFNLDVVYSKWKYTVFDHDREILLAYDSNIKNIEVIDNDVIMLVNSNKKCALYDVNKGYLISFDDDIEFDSAYKLTEDVFKLHHKGEYILLTKKNMHLKKYEDIYITLDNIIIAENLNIIDFYNTNGVLVFSINSNNFYKCDDDIFYCENCKFYHYNFKTNIKNEMNILSLFKLDDGTQLNISIDGVLQNFTHYYCDRKNNVFTLFNNKKCGIEIDFENIHKTCKWFDSIEQKERYLKALSDFFINFPIDQEINDSTCKKKTKKLN